MIPLLYMYLNSKSSYGFEQNSRFKFKFLDIFRTDKKSSNDAKLSGTSQHQLGDYLSVLKKKPNGTAEIGKNRRKSNLRGEETHDCPY